MNKRNLLFASLVLISSFMILSPLIEVVRSSARSDYYSHIPAIPLISAYLLFLQRRTVFEFVSYGPRRGLPLMAAGAVLYAWGCSDGYGWNVNDRSAFLIFSALVFVTGAFIFSYGMKALRSAAFPIFFMIFMIPVPSPIMDKVIYFLQSGSTEVTEWIFKATGILFLREGFVFQLPGFAIAVAKECSGIRSSMALLITVVLAGHFFLKSPWKKAVLAVSLLPIVLIKNGIRISVLTFLALYVDRRFLTGGFLHKSGGILFYIPALAVLGLILWFLRKTERGETAMPPDGKRSNISDFNSEP